MFAPSQQTPQQQQRQPQLQQVQNPPTNDGFNLDPGNTPNNCSCADGTQILPNPGQSPTTTESDNGQSAGRSWSHALELGVNYPRFSGHRTDGSPLLRNVGRACLPHQDTSMTDFNVGQQGTESGVNKSQIPSAQQQNTMNGMGSRHQSAPRPVQVFTDEEKVKIRGSRVQWHIGMSTATKQNYDIRLAEQIRMQQQLNHNNLAVPPQFYPPSQQLNVAPNAGHQSFTGPESLVNLQTFITHANPFSFTAGRYGVAVNNNNIDILQGALGYGQSDGMNYQIPIDQQTLDFFNNASAQIVHANPIQTTGSVGNRPVLNSPFRSENANNATTDVQNLPSSALTLGPTPAPMSVSTPAVPVAPSQAKAASKGKRKATDDENIDPKPVKRVKQPKTATTTTVTTAAGVANKPKAKLGRPRKNQTAEPTPPSSQNTVTHTQDTVIGGPNIVIGAPNTVVDTQNTAVDAAVVTNVEPSQNSGTRLITPPESDKASPPTQTSSLLKPILFTTTLPVMEVEEELPFGTIYEFAQPIPQQVDTSNQSSATEVAENEHNTVDTNTMGDDNYALTNDEWLGMYNGIHQASVPTIGFAFNDELTKVGTDEMTDYNFMMSTTLPPTNDPIFNPESLDFLDTNFNELRTDGVVANSATVTNEDVTGGNAGPQANGETISEENMGGNTMGQTMGEQSESEESVEETIWTSGGIMSFGDEVLRELTETQANQEQDPSLWMGGFWTAEDTDLLGDELMMDLEQNN